MVALHHPSVGLRFAGFDHLAFVVGVVELETVLKNKCEIFIYLFFFNDEMAVKQPIGGQIRGGASLTGFLGSSTSLMLRFSSGMIPRGSLSWRKEETRELRHGQSAKWRRETERRLGGGGGGRVSMSLSQPQLHSPPAVLAAA